MSSLYPAQSQMQSQAMKYFLKSLNILYVYVRAYMTLCVCMCAHALRPEVYFECLPFYTLFLKTGSLLEPGAYRFSKSGWPVNFRDPSVSAFPELDFWHMPPYQHFTGC